eukprot:7164583-Prymnesium_polylepis.1
MISSYVYFTGGWGRSATCATLPDARWIAVRTPLVHENWAAADYVSYWAQRISGEIVTADARRCLKRLPGLRSRVRDASGAAVRACRADA